MIKYLITISSLAGILLTGCANFDGFQKATLKYYSDNRVAFIIKTRENLPTEWKYGLWGSENKILAYQLNGRYYNAQDIESITRVKTDDRLSEIRMKDGKIYRLPPNDIKFFECDNISSCKPADRDFLVPGYVNGLLMFNDVGYNIGYNDSKLTCQDPSILSIQMKSGNDYLAISQLFINLKERIDEKARESYQQAIERNIEFKRLREEQLAERAKMIEQEAQNMRANAKIGTATNCGRIFDIRLPMVGVQTSIGVQYIQLNTLYGPSVGCKFSNGVYVGPGN